MAEKKAASSEKTRVVKVRSTDNSKKNYINIVIAELVGTFVLAMVALATLPAGQVPLFLGLTLAALVMIIGAVSGSHVNPAVTFGLWVVRKIKAKDMAVYWSGQVLGALAAFVAMGAIGTAKSLDFGHFSEFSASIFAIEVIAMAVFMFGIVASTSRKDATVTSSAFGVGLSLMIAVVISTSLGGAAVSKQQDSLQESYKQFVQAKDDKARAAVTAPREARANGATLNPAIAIVSTERTTESMFSRQAPGQQNSETKNFSRIGFEAILGTFIGAAIGAVIAQSIRRNQ